MRKFAKSIGSGGQDAGRSVAVSRSVVKCLPILLGEVSTFRFRVIRFTSSQFICGRPRTAYEGESDSLIKT